MYCENCKKYFSDNSKYCDICGNTLKSKEIKSRKKKKTGLIISIIVISIIMIVGSTVFFGISLYKYIDKIGKIEYLSLGTDKIPTIYMIDKEIKIDEYTKEKNEIEIVYYDEIYNNNIIDRYIKFLEEQGFNYVEKKYDDWILIKESNELGKLIIISIDEYEYDYYDVDYEITYKKINGNISDYVKQGTYK